MTVITKLTRTKLNIETIQLYKQGFRESLGATFQDNAMIALLNMWFLKADIIRNYENIFISRASQQWPFHEHMNSIVADLINALNAGLAKSEVVPTGNQPVISIKNDHGKQGLSYSFPNEQAAIRFNWFLADLKEALQIEDNFRKGKIECSGFVRRLQESIPSEFTPSRS